MATTTAQATPTPQPKLVPRLENGDRLTLDEFERRYDAMPEVKKAELIEGIVYMGSPVRLDQHGQPHSDLMTWLGVYRAHTPGVVAADNTTVKLDPDNMPQPDCVLFIKSAFGGQARVGADGYILGSPELVAEVSASTAKLDLGDKFKVYRRNGVQEYLVWRVAAEQLDWYVLRNGEYLPQAPGADGIIRSEVFPGLWLDPSAMLKGDLAGVLRILDAGIRSPEHAEFAAQLASRS